MANKKAKETININGTSIWYVLPWALGVAAVEGIKGLFRRRPKTGQMTAQKPSSNPAPPAPDVKS